MNRYSLIPFTLDHIELVSKWLDTPEVARWYGDPDYIEDLEEQLDNTSITMRLACFDGAPFAFLQDYDIGVWPNHHLSYLGPSARGIDTFIGDSRMMGQGHGPAYLNILIDELRKAGVVAIGIDPHPHNERAVKAYSKLGFVKDGVAATEWGDVVLMSLNL